MVKKEIFICDHCSKTSVDVTESAEPPYVQGWRYLNDFEFKASTPFRHQIIQKHFCSSACMLAHIEYFVKAQESRVHEELAMSLPRSQPLPRQAQQAGPQQPPLQVPMARRQ